LPELPEFFRNGIAGNFGVPPRFGVRFGARFGVRFDGDNKSGDIQGSATCYKGDNLSGNNQSRDNKNGDILSRDISSGDL
jgi:hypothetical protein